MKLSHKAQLLKIAAELGGKQGEALLEAAGIKNAADTLGGIPSVRTEIARRVIESSFIKDTAPYSCFFVIDSNRPKKMATLVAKAARQANYHLVKEGGSPIDSIASSHAVIAILEDPSPNIFFELGLAAALGKKVLVIGSGKIPQELPREWTENARIGPTADSPDALKEIVAYLKEASAEKRAGAAVHTSPVSRMTSACLLDSIYKAKRYVLTLFWHAAIRVATELEKDYELKGRTGDELKNAVSSIANLLAEPTSIYVHQCLCLHETVRDSIHLPAIEREHCDKVCAAMDQLGEDAQEWVADYLYSTGKISLPLFKDRLQKLIKNASRCESLRRSAQKRLSLYL